MKRGERIDISDHTGAGDGGTTEQVPQRTARSLSTQSPVPFGLLQRSSISVISVFAAGVRQLRFFVDALKAGRPITLPAANLDEAIKTMRVVEATLSSASPLGAAEAESRAAHTRSAANAWRALEGEAAEVGEVGAETGRSRL
eukprot:SAG11_NODE_7199_length_1179_cov_1.157407_2_plen_143_part_00